MITLLCINITPMYLEYYPGTEVVKMQGIVKIYHCISLQRLLLDRLRKCTPGVNMCTHTPIYTSTLLSDFWGSIRKKEK